MKTKILLLIVCSMLFLDMANAQTRLLSAQGVLNFTGTTYNNTTATGIAGIEGGAEIDNSFAGTPYYYSDGANLYNATGTNLGAVGGNFSGAQGAIILLKPGSATPDYYVFAVKGWQQTPGLYYSVYNGTSFTTLPTFLDSCCEQVTAVCDGESGYWIVSHQVNSQKYLAYHLTAGGLNPTPVVSFGIMNYPGSSTASSNNRYGTIVFSPNGLRVANALGGLPVPDNITVEIGDFNPLTGTLSGFKILQKSTSLLQSEVSGAAYSAEFSDNNNVLYLAQVASTSPNQVRQFDLLAGGGAIASIIASRTDVSSYSGTGGSWYVKRGVDGRIYCPRVNGTTITNKMSVIQSPNVVGTGCNFSINAITIPNPNLFGKAVSSIPPVSCHPSLIVNAGHDDTICAGYATQLSGTSSGSGPFTYSWAPAAGLSCTSCQNPIATPLTTTTYTLTVTSGSSSGTDAVTITVNENCCSANNNDLFTMINSNMTISANTYFTGKYFVGPGVTITVSGVSLDLTNVDMVFSPCSGIEFHNGATLVANNSVFRPCDINLWWNGFSFFDGSVGTINSCTFENAGAALSFNGATAPATYSNITNNLFLNCRKGVSIVGGTKFLESITNNVFTVDFNSIDYSIPNCSGPITTPYEYHAIEVTASDLSTTYISQNQFINNQVGQGSTAIVSGIYYLSVAGSSISQNTFTNLYRDIDASLSANFSIENNEMEQLQFNSSKPFDYQIRLSQCSYVWVNGNHLINSLEYVDIATSSAAIYTENGTFLNVKDNVIDGCLNGILSFNDLFTVFSGNKLNGVNSYGIYVSNLSVGTVNCNQIHMQSHINLPVFNVGIAYVNCGGNFNNILNNCIFDAGTAMLLSSSLIGTAGPAVANNYLYNYASAGINNQGYSMNLGSGASTYGVSGHNTFTSNKGISAVYDVFSTTPMIAYGNYGIGTVNSNVTTVGNNVYSSTASCGQQIGPYANDQGVENICDFYFLNLQDVVNKPASGAMMLSPSFEETVNSSQSLFSLSEFTALLQLLQSANPEEADKLVALVENNGWLSAPDFGIFKFNHSFFAYDFATAATDLNVLNGSVDENWFSVKSILVNHLNNHGSLYQISNDELQALKMIEQSASPFAADARELLQATAGGYDYHFKAPQIFKSIEAGSAITLSKSLLNIYPNPAHGEATIQFVLPDGLSEAVLVIYDLSGSSIETLKLDAANSLVKINLENLSNGSYLIAIETDGKILLRGKLIKN